MKMFPERSEEVRRTSQRSFQKFLDKFTDSSQQVHSKFPETCKLKILPCSMKRLSKILELSKEMPRSFWKAFQNTQKNFWEFLKTAHNLQKKVSERRKISWIKFPAEILRSSMNFLKKDS